MPHFTIEYSANLEGVIDMTAFCDTVRRAALDTGMFEIGAVRVRAMRCEHYSVADARAENSFIDVSARIGAGRDGESKKRVGDALFAAMTEWLGPLFPGEHFALSFEIREIDPVFSYKKNSMHTRLRK